MDKMPNKKSSLVELVGTETDGRRDNHLHPRTVIAVNNEEDSKHEIHEASSLVIDDRTRRYTTANITTSFSKQPRQLSNFFVQDQEPQEQLRQHEGKSRHQHKKHSVTQFISAINRHSAVEDLAPVWALEESRTPHEGGKDGTGKTRETWDKKVDFLLSMIGFAVDLANVWRFPYLCYKNGGGAFLIPYFTMLVFGAVPMFFMELVLGQCHKSGGIAVWKIVPIFKGIGICQCMIAIFVAFYYNVIIAWSLYYLISSLTTALPWTTCDNYWNTERCSTTAGVSVSNVSHIGYNQSDTFGPSQMVNISVDLTMPEKLAKSYMTPTEEFFERKVLGLQLSSGLEDIGSPRVELVLCLLAVFFIIYFSVWKGVKTSGKVVWVTATMPYVVLTVLFIRGLMLPGSGQGIMYYITPRLERLGDPHVWIDAAVQIFYSSGAGFGVHIAFASYNKLRHNCYRDCLITVFVNSFTSLYSGFVIFAYLGYMAASQSKDIASVAAEGPGLVFVVYPEAIATLPGSIFWSILFFVMLITLGIDSAMGGLEALLTGISDEFRQVMTKFKYSRELLTLFVVLAAFIFSLPNVTNGGMYLVTMWDTFAAGTSILTGVFAEVIAVAWIYGMEQFCQDINYILNFKPNIYWRFCWKIVSPALLLVMIVSSIASFKPLEYSSYTQETYTYPAWANIMGWLIAASSISCIPLVAIYQLLSTKGTFKQRLALNISPYWEHESIKTDGRVKRFQKSHWLW